MNALTKAAAGRTDKAKMINVFLNLAIAVVFTAVEVLAAMRLDGWLVIALLVIAAWNVLRIGLALFGFMQISVEAINRERGLA